MLIDRIKIIWFEKRNKNKKKNAKEILVAKNINKNIKNE